MTNTKSTFYLIPIAILIAAIVIAGGIVYKYKNAPAPETSTLEKSQPVIGLAAPLFNLKTSKGVEIKLEDLRGQNVLLVFWSTNCDYCVGELTDLKQFTDKYRGQITVLAITYKETAQTVKEYEDKEKINFTMLLDLNGETAEKLYIIAGTPSHFFVDKQGKIISVWPAQTNLYNLEYMAKQLLSQ